MVRSAATPRVSNHEAVAELVRIQFFKQRHFLRTQLRDLAARFRAMFARNVPPSEIQRAQGMPGARCARSLVCEKTNTRAKSPRSHRNDPAFPAQWFYGLLRALPGDHACLTPSPALPIADLTPGIGASEPHDLAVRRSAIRQLRCSVHRIPPRVRDDREPPLCGTGQCESVN